jgi:DNA-binding CsgD family transcriptional regulator
MNRITARELDVLSAWWLLHSTRAVARFFALSEQTVKNHLMNARIRNGVHSSAALAQLFMGDLRTMEELLASHNVGRKEAA